MPWIKEIIMPFARSTPSTPEQQAHAKAHAEAVEAKHDAYRAQQTISFGLAMVGLFLLFRQR